MKLYLFLLCSILAACGGSNKLEQDKVFDLKNINSLKQGVVYSSYLQSTDKPSVFYGNFSIENGPEEILDGVMVTPRVVTFRTMNGLTGSSSIPNGGWDVTYYIETSTGNIISFKKSFYFSEYVLNCKSSSPYHLPSTVRPGDTDFTPSFNCENQKILSGGSWSAVYFEKDKVIFSEISKTIDELGNNQDITISYVLDSVGNIISVTLDGFSSI